jgi:hypothetical protein
MTDCVEVINNIPNKRQQYKNAFYRNKILNNPEFHAQEKLRIKEYNKARYNSDPEYAEKVRAKRRASYAKSKLVSV